MKIIEKLSDMMEEELHDAEKYAKCAIKYADEFPELSHVFATLSREEMRHQGMLHEQAERIIATHRKEHGEPPAAMKAVYDYLHARMIDKAHEIEMLQAKMKR
jgi:ferritin